MLSINSSIRLINKKGRAHNDNGNRLDNYVLACIEPRLIFRVDQM